MLIADFYTIETLVEREDGCEAVLLLNASHPIYKGHFKGHPVLPGVCSLQLIKEVAESRLSAKLSYAQVSTCKFLAMVNPVIDSRLQLSISISEVAEGYTVQASGTWNNQPFIKLKAQLKALAG